MTVRKCTTCFLGVLLCAAVAQAGPDSLRAPDPAGGAVLIPGAPDPSWPVVIYPDVPTFEATGVPIGGPIFGPRAIVEYTGIPGSPGYSAFAAATGLIGFDDYTSGPNPNIYYPLETIRFVGGVTAAGGTLQFQFYDASTNFKGAFNTTFTGAGNFIYTIGAVATPINLPIPGKGIFRIVALTGTTGQWFLTTVAPTIGTNSLTYRPAAGFFQAFELSAINSPDCNSNGTPDYTDQVGNDCNTNGRLDICEGNCNTNGTPDVCEALYKDCNTNFTMDSCEPPSQTAVCGDCNSNGTLDVNEIAGNDCNTNATLDACDTGLFGFRDCNTNQRPDICAGEGANCNTNLSLDVCELAAGATDCNTNGTLDICGEDCNTNARADACDVRSGTGDCNTNHTPDVCDRDCNTNGRPDACDLAMPTATDCNSNGTIDVCDISSLVVGYIGADSGSGYYADGNRPQEVADDFVLASATSIVQVKVRGFFSATAPAANLDQYTVRFWNDATTNAGAVHIPGTLAASRVVPATSVTRTPEGTNAFELTLALGQPVGLAAGTYWCEVFYSGTGTASGTGTPQWVWRYSTTLSGFSIAFTLANPEGAWTTAADTTHTLFFALYGQTSTDCNTNLNPDACDIASTPAIDANHNGRIDLCEDCNTNNIPDPNEGLVDCNSNTTPDICDTALPDCNTNQTLDVCEMVDCNTNGTLDRCEPSDCNTNNTLDLCEVDCNTNGTTDACESLANCNTNNTPDVCEFADCNTNGLHDPCEAGGDCNSNRVPDVCEVGRVLTQNASNGASVLIPDNDPNNGAVSVITVFTAGAVLDVNVGVNIAHTWDSDLDILLGHGPFVIVLATQEGLADDDDFTGTVFDDSAATSISLGTAPFTGTFQPEQPLNIFALSNTGKQGAWALGVFDFVGGDTGTLLNWSLEIRAANGSDCNTNGTPDACDALALDCNSNGLPDVCDRTKLSPTNIASTDTPLAIPDNAAAGVTSNVTVAAAGTVADVNVSVSIQHTFDSDLELFVSSATTTFGCLLASGDGGSGDDFTNTLFDDQAATQVYAGTAPFAGAFKPLSQLAIFNGQPLADTWSLNVSDGFATDTGTLLSWTLVLSTRVSNDANTNGVPDECEVATCATCTGDINGDSKVDGQDIAGWVRCAFGASLPGDNCACASGMTQAQFISKLLTDLNTACP